VEVRVLEGARKLSQTLSLVQLLPDDAEVGGGMGHPGLLRAGTPILCLVRIRSSLLIP
jgi:hypothetical protein